MQRARIQLKLPVLISLMDMAKRVGSDVLPRYLQEKPLAHLVEDEEEASLTLSRDVEIAHVRCAGG